MVGNAEARSSRREKGNGIVIDDPWKTNAFTQSFSVPRQNLWVPSGEEAVFLVVGVVVPTTAANVWPKAFLSS